MKLAVVFPGIGYHKDKPLLYYSSRIAQNSGYETRYIEYHDMPQKIRGNLEMMKKAAALAFMQTKEQLDDIVFSDYDDVLFIGKSIGTVVLTRYATARGINARQIWYTPVEATFSSGTHGAIAFIGDDDPWSNVDLVKKLAAQQKIELHSYPLCNHSLECDDIDQNLINLRNIMDITGRFINGQI